MYLKVQEARPTHQFVLSVKVSCILQPLSQNLSKNQLLKLNLNRFVHVGIIFKTIASPRMESKLMLPRQFQVIQAVVQLLCISLPTTSVH